MCILDKVYDVLDSSLLVLPGAISAGSGANIYVNGTTGFYRNSANVSGGNMQHVPARPYMIFKAL